MCASSHLEHPAFKYPGVHLQFVISCHLLSETTPWTALFKTAAHRCSLFISLPMFWVSLVVIWFLPQHLLSFTKPYGL